MTRIVPGIGHRPVGPLPSTVVILMLLMSARLVGQTFQSRTTLVTIPVTVTNRSGTDRIRDLTADQFRVFEGRLEQDIVAFTRERRPISVCIVLDSSMSMKGPRQGLASTAVSRIIAGLEPDDEAALVVFAGHAEVPIPWTRAAAFPRIDWTNWQTAPNTALLDGVRQALQLIDTSRNPRAAVLVVSDGGENASKATLATLTTTRRQSEIVIYSLRMDDFWNGRSTAPGPPIDGNAGPASPGQPALTTQSAPDVLEALATDSGGWQFAVHNAGDAQRAANSLLDELRFQYVLGYEPRRPADGMYRSVKVEMRNPAFRVRYRRGYLALPSP